MQHCILLVEVGVGGQDGWVREVLHRSTYFYADYGMVVSTDPFWLQVSFDSLTKLFDKVGIRTNVDKKAEMLCHPFCAVGTHLEAAYKRHMKGEGLACQSRQRLRVQCLYCGMDLAVGLLEFHR